VISSSLDNNSTLPISFRYILIESSEISERETEAFLSFFSTFFSVSKRFSLSKVSTISTHRVRNLVYTSSNNSRSSSAFGIAAITSS
jgi:hypothetical protein